MPGPKHLNEAIERTYHKTATLEEISHKFHGATVSSNPITEGKRGSLLCKNLLNKGKERKGVDLTLIDI